MNTLMHYLYRDSENNKVHTAVVLKGEITEQQKEKISACLENGSDFIPSQVGLLDNRFETLEAEDQPWFELYPKVDFQLTHLPADVELSVDELTQKFESAQNNWDEDAFFKKQKSS